MKVCCGAFIINDGQRWIERDKCQAQVHFKCIPEKHLNSFGLEECDEDDDELAFICHFCATDIDSSCEEFNLDGREEDDYQTIIAYVIT